MSVNGMFDRVRGEAEWLKRTGVPWGRVARLFASPLPMVADVAGTTAAERRAVRARATSTEAERGDVSIDRRLIQGGYRARLALVAAPFGASPRTLALAYLLTHGAPGRLEGHATIIANETKAMRAAVASVAKVAAVMNAERDRRAPAPPMRIVEEMRARLATPEGAREATNALATAIAKILE